MAVFAATSVTVTIGGTDVTDYVESVELSVNSEQIDVTNMNSSGWNEFIGGLKSAQVSFTLQQDFVDDGLDEDLWALLGTSTAITIKPTSSAVGAGNPSYQFNALVTTLTPVATQVGQKVVQSLNWPVTGSITRAVA